MECTTPALPGTYVKALESIHRIWPEYGTGGIRFQADLLREITSGGYRSVLDYGCGKGRLVASLDLALAGRGVCVKGYDPAVPVYSSIPEPADMVVCIDVLDALPAAMHQTVAAHLATLTRRCIVVAIQRQGEQVLTSAAGEVIRRLPLSISDVIALLGPYFEIGETRLIDTWDVLVARTRQSVSEDAA